MDVEIDRREGLSPARGVGVGHQQVGAESDETALNTTLSGPCSAAIARSLAAVKSSASSQLMRCLPGSGLPLGRVRFSG